MKLSCLIANVDGVTVLGDSDPDIGAVTDDSRKVAPGSLFIARGGTRGDGRAFIEDAIARGAAAVLCEGSSRAAEVARGGAVALSCDDAAARGVDLAHARAGFPATALRSVGITGTNGKTTVAFLVQHMLGHAGTRCGLLGTVVNDDGVRRVPAELTTPGGVELAGMLAAMVANGCGAVSMEVSSHALDQGRARGIPFAVAVFTNLTGDHLDYHGSMEAYAASKARLFGGLCADAWAVVNADDPAHARMLQGCTAKVLRCSAADGDANAGAGAGAGARAGAQADCLVRVVRASLGGMRLHMRGPWGEFEAEFPCVGRHNAMNALQAVAAAWAAGVPAAMLAPGLSTAQAPPGRLQPVTAPADPFAVLVDYAHTDDALLNVLAALRPVAGSGRILLVFGCGGDRDRTKRPRMAATAVRGADEVFVTSDNPRTEDPAAIIAEILAGVPAQCSGRVRVEADRSRAIAMAVNAARAGDIVLIAGKGHEDYQIIGTQKRHFDDREQALHALRARTALGAAQASSTTTPAAPPRGTGAPAVRAAQGAHT